MELTRLTHTIALRVAHHLEPQGLLEQDTGNIYLTPEAVDASDDDPLNRSLPRIHALRDLPPSELSRG